MKAPAVLALNFPNWPCPITETQIDTSKFKQRSAEMAD